MDRGRQGRARRHRGARGRILGSAGIVHYLYDYSPDMEYLEIVSPADFKTVDMPPATDKVPPVTAWK